MSDDRAGTAGGHAWATGASKRGARLAPVEVRERLLDLAMEMLADTGLTVSLSHLSLEELMRQADVPRSSVRRVWPTTQAFYLDLMERMIEAERSQGMAFDQEALDIATAVVEQYQDRLSTVEGRWSVMREAVRQAVERNFYAVSESLSWRTFIALVATLPALQPEDQERLIAALRTTEAHFIDRMVEFYATMMPILGLRPKEGFNLRAFAAAASSLTEGMIGRRLTNPTIVTTPIMLPGIDGNPVEWHLAAAACLGILEVMVEPDDDWKPAQSAS
ncbi:TetR/AcrR family transcriptional regulator [Nocardia niigatensis]